MFVFTKGPFTPDDDQSLVKGKTSGLLMEGCRRLDEVPEEQPKPKRKLRLLGRKKK